MGFVFTVMIALFGTLYYIIKYFVRSSKTDKLEAENIKNDHDTVASLNSWENDTVDSDYECYLRKALDGGGEKAQELIRMAEELAGGEEWYAEICHTTMFYQRILMADRGKLLSMESRFGMKPFIYKRYTPQEKSKIRTAYSKLHLWVAKKLRENGVNAVPIYSGLNGYWYLNSDGADATVYGWKAVIPAHKWGEIHGEQLF